ncbi:alpha-glucosidase [Lapillicoccus sp.]|uniref:glycoside hydrolase family 13 protein n=1 Tax=Lapillicoccus sp. TaxID=1909287 RepID=UPI0025FB166E|nr:alpha-glucosidase [Lapillicoccus sp.]
MTTSATTADESPWWQKAVVYQVYPRSFADSDGDGVGDLRGIIDHLDHIARLGVDVIWLSPVYRSPMDDNGYDISDYEDIDPLFGDLATFDELVAGIHARGMRLMMDLVVNHTSDEHPWFVASRSSPLAPQRDWYVWRPPREGFEAGAPGAEPNNWESFFSGPAWELDEASGEYYLHLFSRKQPDLDWENPAVRGAVHAMMRRWLERGVDGFRMDVINLISKVPGLPDGVVHATSASGSPLGDGAPFVTNGPRIHEFLREMNEAVWADRSAPDLPLVTVGEMPGSTVEEARLYTDPARHELDMVFTFEHVGLDQGRTKFDRLPLRVSRLKQVLARWQDGLAEVGWNSLYWGNHDQPRAVSRFGDDAAYRVLSAKLLATVLHLHRGTPYVYQGEELGMPNAGFARIEDYRDIESLNHHREATASGVAPGDVLAALQWIGRDNARTPMPWDDGPQAGFTTGTPWLRLTPGHEQVNAAAAWADPDSVLHHYRHLVALRHHEPAVSHGDFALLAPDDEILWAFTRQLGSTRLLVVANLSGADLDVSAVTDGWRAAEVISTNYAASKGDWSGTTLRPWEAVVLRRTA